MQASLIPSARPVRPLQGRPVGGRPARGLRRLQTCSAFIARWQLDVRFGGKADAVQLLQEWVQQIGSEAGLTPDNTSLSTGSIGAPESTLELEVRFDSLAELEGFWSAIPQQQHKAWGQRMQQYIVHGSPQWHVYRCLPAFPDGTPAASGSAAALGSRGSGSAPRGRPGTAAAASSSGGSLVMPSDEELGKYAEPADGAAPLPSTKQQTASGLSIVSGDDEVQTVLDWKGEPMQVRPGDKLPGVRFL
ncbi:hypothetical protein C2E21_8037 [Chlorella sorokiniana]|uniref:Uncharacterized protein n=1 Tax=Chlorella sorokiniana TaxID=3076 RepID=A0A2P6TG02_CHLSO|nr:hypothetical protein C2E21_8037 [Chlorella sorokiniana]|eukprot:PRW33051.1 hypothetical protein C2E21_8037 [Chlorella sorokiniana]